jgi:hypothetical protein
MATATLLDREEYVEQAYLFRALRERLAQNLAAQAILERVHEEILATTRLPYAIQFLTGELKHSGLLSTGFAGLPHYFTPYQTFLVRQTEREALRFSVETALLVLEREASYRAHEPTRAGLFFFQFEVLSRNRLGYDEGLTTLAADPMYDETWREYVDLVRRQLGSVDFADLVFLRSEYYVQDQRRRKPDYQPPRSPLFAEKEGKIARASHGRDPLYFFAAIQRQLGYPEVPHPRPPDDLASRLEVTRVKVRELEQRLQLLESEMRGHVDFSKFGKPDILAGPAAGDDV